MRKGLLLAVLLAMLAYLGSVSNRFLFDDIGLIVINPAIRSLGEVEEVVSAGRPIRGLSFILDYQLWGLQPGKWHATNIFLHMLCVATFFITTKRLFKSNTVSTISSCIFAVHPAVSEAVIAVSHRKEMLAMFFILLCINLYLNYLEESLSDEKKNPYGGIVFLGGAFGAYLLGLGSKQVVIITPLILIAVRQVICGGSALNGVRKNWHILALMLAVPLLAALSGSGDWKLRGQVNADTIISTDYLIILATGLKSFFKYITTLLYPINLSAEHFFRNLAQPINLYTTLGFMSLAGLVGLVIVHKNKPAGFGSLWFILNIIMVLNIIPANQVFAERYLYIPSAGFALIVADLAAYCMKMQKERMKILGWVAGIVFGMSIMVFITKNTGYLFKNLASIGGFFAIWCILAGAVVWLIISRVKRQGLQSVKKLILLVSLLALFLSVAPHAIYIAKDSEEGINEPLSILFKKEIYTFEEGARWIHTQEIPDPERSRFDIAFRYAGNMLLPAIIMSLAAFFVVRRARGSGSTAVVLICASMLFLLGEMTVIRCKVWKSDSWLWRDVITQNPYSSRAYNNLATYYQKKSQWLKATRSYSKSLQLNPGNATMWFNQGTMYLMLKDFEMARKSFEKVVELDHKFHLAYVNLGNIELENGKPEGAIKYYKKAISINPKNARAYYNMAQVLKNMGHIEEAMQSCRKALEINPKYAKAQYMCGETGLPL